MIMPWIAYIAMWQAIYQMNLEGWGGLTLEGCGG